MGDGNGEWGWEVADSNLKKKKSVIPCKNPFSSANPQHPSPADFLREIVLLPSPHFSFSIHHYPLSLSRVVLRPTIFNRFSHGNGKWDIKNFPFRSARNRNCDTWGMTDFHHSQFPISHSRSPIPIEGPCHPLLRIPCRVSKDGVFN